MSQSCWQRGPGVAEQVKCLLQGLGLHRLAPEPALRLAPRVGAPQETLTRHLSALNAATPPTATRVGANDPEDWLLHRRRRASAKMRLPLSWLSSTLRSVCFGRSPRPARRCRNALNPLIVIRHQPVLEDIPKPAQRCQVPDQHGGQVHPHERSHRIECLRVPFACRWQLVTGISLGQANVRIH